MNINPEDKVILDQFKPRDYQEPILDAIFNRGIKRMVVCLPRRSGKDFTLFQAAVWQCMMKPCMVMYVGVNYGSVRKTIWDLISIDGKKLLDFIPKRWIDKVNQSDMKIVFKNQSILQCIGADSHETSLRGTNPYGIILSEFAYYEDPTVLDTVTPILAANNGWLCLASTPAGKNTFYQVYNLAKQLPDWWVYTKTVEQTEHISYDQLESERRRMSPELFAQEYMCDFNRGIDGAIFGKALARLKQNGQITHVSWEPGLLVHTAWDIGISKGNENCIIFFQVVGNGISIRIIDCYSSNQIGLDVYASILAEKVEKGYKYGVHLGPHDLRVRENSDAVTRYQKAKNLGIDFIVLDQFRLEDQIETALTHFPKIWIDSTKCQSLIDALENYYRQWDEQRKIYSKPVHNWASNYSSAFMAIFLGLGHTQSSPSGEEYDKIRAEVLYGQNANLPRIFRLGMQQNNQGF